MATTTAPAITTRAQYEVLRLFACRKTDQQIADQLKLGRNVVTPIINDLTGGDHGIAAGLVAAYENRARAVAAAQGKPGVPGVPRITTVPPAGTLRPPAAAPAVARATDVLADLLAAASASPHQRTRSLGAKLSALAEDLRTRLADERRAAEAAEAAARAKAEAQRRVDELAAELAKARAQLRAAGGGQPARRDAGKNDKPVGDVPAKTVRAWARENGIEVPALGRIPHDVMDAYRQHHAKEQ